MQLGALCWRCRLPHPPPTTLAPAATCAQNQPGRGGDGRGGRGAGAHARRSRLLRLLCRHASAGPRAGRCGAGHVGVHAAAAAWWALAARAERLGSRCFCRCRCSLHMCCLLRHAQRTHTHTRALAPAMQARALLGAARVACLASRAACRLSWTPAAAAAPRATPPRVRGWLPLPLGALARPACWRRWCQWLDPPWLTQRPANRPLPTQCCWAGCLAVWCIRSLPATPPMPGRQRLRAAPGWAWMAAAWAKRGPWSR